MYGDVSMYAARLRSVAQFDPNSRATSGLVRDSSRSTSAPWKASARQQLGAAMAIDSSTTVRPSKTPNWPPPDGQRGRPPAWHVRVGGSARVLTLGPPPAQPALHEVVEVAVEHGGDVPRLDVGAQVLHHLVRLQHVRADLAAPPHLGLLAGDGVELGLALLLDLRRVHRLEATQRLLPVLELAALLLRAGDEAGRL